MDKNAIKKYAIWARRELIARISQKAEEFGITEQDISDPEAESINGRLLTPKEKMQRNALILHIYGSGYQSVIEEVAYTWFNRFCALRFMEVNNYLPTRIRIFTDEANTFKPQILAEAIHLEMDGLDMDVVYQLKNDSKTEELYKYLLITQCNALSSILPGMFQQIADYTELLLPDNLLREGSVIEEMISQIPEADWREQVEIIGWLYQYYNTELKDETFELLKKNVKITKERIGAATQLFTPEWIVRYMVENSLGRLWLEGHPDAALRAGWKYYMDEAEQEPEVAARLAELRVDRARLRPEQITLLDPCMGSGHILAAAFDVLMDIYRSVGYTDRDAAQSIVENNLYGLDIDDRAAQLAYFTVMMKACEYDRKFLRRNVQPNVGAVQAGANLPVSVWGYFGPMRETALRIYTAFENAKEFGSLIDPGVTLAELDALEARMEEMYKMADYGNLSDQAFTDAALSVMWPLARQARMLVRKYDVVCTNPPYMGSSGMNGKLSKFVKDNYPDSKSDMSTAFMEQCTHLCAERGYISMINIPVWMFLSSYERLRGKMIASNCFINMLHFGRGIFGSDFGTTSFVVAKKYTKRYTGTYRRLFEKQGAVDSPEQKEKWFHGGMGVHTAQQENFSQIPGAPIAYWVSESFTNAFHNKMIGSVLTTREGMATADNDRFLRFWYELDFDHIEYDGYSKSVLNGKQVWVPYNKGGDFRKWYGNNDYVVFWENNGWQIKNNADPKTGRIRSHNYNGVYGFRKGITWSALSSGAISVRFSPEGFLFDSKGAKGFSENDEDLLICLGIINSNVGAAYLQVLSPTIDFKVGDIIEIPYIVQEKAKLYSIVQGNIDIARSDWDSFETSWDFKKHPLVGGGDK